MKALVVYDPKSKFTLDALKAVEYKLAELENLELVYVADHNHERMENPKEYNLKMEKEGPEWITPEPEVMEQIKDADILMTSFCGVTRAMLEAGKNLKLVFMMRSGWENCNVKAAKELGIPVCNCPSRLAEPVADLTVAMMICECRATATFSTVSGTRTISTTTRRTQRSATSASACTVTAESAAPSQSASSRALAPRSWHTTSTARPSR